MKALKLRRKFHHATLGRRGCRRRAGTRTHFTNARLTMNVARYSRHNDGSDAVFHAGGRRWPRALHGGGGRRGINTTTLLMHETSTTTTPNMYDWSCRGLGYARLVVHTTPICTIGRGCLLLGTDSNSGSDFLQYTIEYYTTL